MAITKEKAERIAQEYAKTGYMNKTQTLVNCGYSFKYSKGIGQYLLENVRVKGAIAKIKANISKKTGVSIEWVVNNLKTVAERCMKEPFDNPGANKALQLLGMHVDAFNADNKSKAPDMRTFSIKELKVLIIEGEKRDSKILDAGLGVVE